MKQSITLWSLLCLIATPLVSIAQTGTNNRLLFTTDLNGGQEVPAVATDARGIATILISEDRTTMSVHAVFSGLSGSVTGCHIHTGGEGVAGPVFVNFSNNVTGNRLRAEIPIPADFMSRALKNELYLNVHTALNPSGEIRGQLGLKTENLYAIDVLQQFKKQRCYFGIVVDEFGAFEGVITLHDLAEALVGDLPDQDGEPAELTVRDDQSLLINGSMLVHELNHYLDLEFLPENSTQYSTLAGFIIHHLERIPDVGERFEYNGYRIEIVDKDGARVDKVILYPGLGKTEAE